MEAQPLKKCSRRCGAKHTIRSQMKSRCTKCIKTHHSRTTFGSQDVEKVHAVVARSTFRSQNVTSTLCSDHFCTFNCCGRGDGFCTLPRVTQTKRFCLPHWAADVSLSHLHLCLCCCVILNLAAPGFWHNEKIGS